MASSTSTSQLLGDWTVSSAWANLQNCFCLFRLQKFPAFLNLHGLCVFLCHRFPDPLQFLFGRCCSILAVLLIKVLFVVVLGVIIVIVIGTLLGGRHLAGQGGRRTRIGLVVCHTLLCLFDEFGWRNCFLRHCCLPHRAVTQLVH